MNNVRTEVDTNNPEFQNWLRGVLHDNDIKDLCVTFTKKDGTERKMFCTLAESLIPADKIPKEAGSTGGSALRVFDTQLNEWRSFRWDSITDINFTLP